ncbi:MAG: dephospho-CoA kinase [Patescibacteria group bacterium]|nr:dephospho-CoA kinase [Patescibacteria group bacterium]
MPSAKHSNPSDLLVPELVGICGRIASGKDTGAAILVEEYGYTHVSLSTEVHQAVDYFGLGEHSRENLKTAGTLIRMQHGVYHLVNRALLTPERPLVVSGIYAVEEAERIKQAGGLVVAIVAEQTTRLQRATERARSGAQQDTNDFVRADLIDDSGNYLSLSRVIEFADVTVDSSTMESLQAGIQALTSQGSPE